MIDLPDDWTAQRDTMQRVVSHVLAPARRRRDGLFDLVPAPGGVATPHVGPDRWRARVTGATLVVESAVGSRLATLETTYAATSIDGATLRELAAFVGVEPDPDFSVGHDTPALGDPDATIHLDTRTGRVLGDWYALGSVAIDAAVSTLDDPTPALARVWPEHFDLGTDVRVDDELRCNLGASAGDAAIDEPYLYVGPWTSVRPGDAAFWDQPFGATLTRSALADEPDPLGRAVDFLSTGLRLLVDRP